MAKLAKMKISESASCHKSIATENLCNHWCCLKNNQFQNMLCITENKIYGFYYEDSMYNVDCEQLICEHFAT